MYISKYPNLKKGYWCKVTSVTKTSDKTTYTLKLLNYEESLCYDPFPYNPYTSNWLIKSSIFKLKKSSIFVEPIDEFLVGDDHDDDYKEYDDIVITDNNIKDGFAIPCSKPTSIYFLREKYVYGSVCFYVHTDRTHLDGWFKK